MNPKQKNKRTPLPKPKDDNNGDADDSGTEPARKVSRTEVVKAIIYAVPVPKQQKKWEISYQDYLPKLCQLIRVLGFPGQPYDLRHNLRWL